MDPITKEEFKAAVEVERKMIRRTKYIIDLMQRMLGGKPIKSWWTYEAPEGTHGDLSAFKDNYIYIETDREFDWKWEDIYELGFPTKFLYMTDNEIKQEIKEDAEFIKTRLDQKRKRNFGLGVITLYNYGYENKTTSFTTTSKRFSCCNQGLCS